MKKYLLSIVAVVMAICASAFTVINEDVWYVFTSQDVNDISDRTKYQNTGLSQSPGCGVEGDICAIKLPDSGGNHPVENDFLLLVDDIEDSQLQESSTSALIEMED